MFLRELSAEKIEFGSHIIFYESICLIGLVKWMARPKMTLIVHYLRKALLRSVNCWVFNLDGIKDRQTPLQLIDFDLKMTSEI